MRGYTVNYVSSQFDWILKTIVWAVEIKHFYPSFNHKITTKLNEDFSLMQKSLATFKEQYDIPWSVII